MVQSFNFTTNLASKTCAAGNFAVTHTKRRTDESGGLSLPTITSFPTILIVISHKALYRNVVRCQRQALVGAHNVILGLRAIKYSIFPSRTYTLATVLIMN